MGVTSVTLTGGEPTLRPEIIEAAYEVFGTGCIVIINGTNPPTKHKTRFFISRHFADNERQDLLCGVSGTGVKIDKNTKEGDDRIVYTTVLHHGNADQIIPMVELTRKKKIRGIVFSGYSPEKRKPGQPSDPLALTEDDVRYIVPTLLKVWKENQDIVLMTPEIIQMFRTKKHRKGCNLRDGWVLSLDSEGKPIKKCVMGENASCDECMCVIPMQAEALKRALWLALIRLDPDITVRAMETTTDTFIYKPRDTVSDPIPK
jgi:MoaA/NifB/PqqE/SkfB family radical SAM enzyme